MCQEDERIRLASFLSLERRRRLAKFDFFNTLELELGDVRGDDAGLAFELDSDDEDSSEGEEDDSDELAAARRAALAPDAALLSVQHTRVYD